MSDQKTYNTMAKIPEHFTQDATLSSLERILCSKLKLGPDNQPICNPDKEDLTTGTINITLLKNHPKCFEEKIKNIIQDFYYNEGYNLNDDKKGIFSVQKQEEENYIFIFKSENSYLISVCKNPDK